MPHAETQDGNWEVPRAHHPLKLSVTEGGYENMEAPYRTRDPTSDSEGTPIFGEEPLP